MFTENQTRQFYVATSTSADVIAPVQVDGNALSPVLPTDLKGKSAGACQFILNNDGDAIHLNYLGPSDDGLQRSDIIKVCNIKSVTLTDAADMLHKKMRKEITLDSNVNSGTPVVGQDYILNVTLKNYIAPGDDSQKIKFGVYKATNTTAATLYEGLAVSLAKNFAREPVPVVSIALKTTGADIPVSDKDTITSLATAATTATVTVNGIVLEEVEQPWRLGAARQEFVNFDVNPSTIYTGNMDQIWGTVNDVTSTNTNTIPNSKKVADMEYFFHKNRGDAYGFAGWPTNIDTTYLVNSSNSDGYSFIDIRFYFEGNSHNVGHSEKTLTVVGTKANLKKLFGSPYVPADDPSPAVDATGFYAWLEGTGVKVKTSASW